MSLAVAILGFLLCAAVIFLAGGRLARYGELISEATGLGGAWIGMILLATVTSLPELMVGISSSVLVRSADLAMGDVLGSCAFNLFILAALDAFVPQRKPLFGLASGRNVLMVGLEILLLALVGLSIVRPVEVTLTPWISVPSVLFLVTYLVAARLVYRQAQGGRADQQSLDSAEASAGPQNPEALTMRQVGVRFALFTVIIVVAAAALPPFARGIAQGTGLQESLVGTLFLAATTSLPELAVSLSLVRMGAIDLAVGNLLGSNLFDIAILAIDDVFYTPGLLLQDSSPVHLISVMSTIAMSAIAVIGLTYRIPGKRLLLAWDAALIIAIYMTNLVLMGTF